MKFIKSKEFIYILLIILLIGVTSVLLFFPDLIENKYPYSYQALTLKKGEVENNNSTLHQNEGRISSSINQLDETKKREIDSEAEALEIRKGIKETDFELKVSSILISLEQRAYENNVDLSIAYSLIKHTTGTGEVNDYEMPPIIPNEGEIPPEGTPGETPPEGTPPMETPPVVQPPVIETPTDGVVVETKPGDKEEVKENIEPEFTEERITQGMVSIPGIDVAVIPITVEGSYYNLRNYIKYLDQIGMIEPSSVVLTSNGKSITATIILNVFHGEVGL